MIPHNPGTEKLALVMVGLPARGKTFVARKIARYLAWLGYRARVFNVGDYRRALAGAKQPAQFFDPQNTQDYETRVNISLAALGDMIAWFRAGGEVGIFDATNSERSRRQRVHDMLRKEGVHVVFIESICEDETVVEANVRETKLRSPDYVDVDPGEAVADFRARIAHYEASYEPIDDKDQSFVKIIDVGRQFVVNRVEGYLNARLIFFLMNIHPARRRIFLTRHGECRFNVEGRIGGDTELSARGIDYSRSLAQLMAETGARTEGLVTWTSTLRRTLQTAQSLTSHPVAWRALDEIDAGVCDGMTYAEIKEQQPEEYAARGRDKFRYRYPRGESYADVIQRLEPVIVELERQRVPVLVIAHQAVVRALYGYLMGRPQDECPYLPVPLHTVIALTPTAYGYEERRYELEPRVVV